jgi:hypothetical protein
MTLTAARCVDHIRHTLGNALPSQTIDPMTVINQAGQFLCTMHEWKWLERQSAYIGFTSGQSYSTCPSDLRDVISIQFTQGLVNRVRITSINEISRLRSHNIGVGLAMTWVALVSRANPTGGAPIPILELYPTPVSTDNQALTIYYRSGWTPPLNLDESSQINIPEYLEPLYIQILRAFARGYEEEDQASLDTRLQALYTGVLFLTCAERDGMIQHQYGPPLQTGLSAVGTYLPGVPASPYTVGNPTP